MGLGTAPQTGTPPLALGGLAAQLCREGSAALPAVLRTLVTTFGLTSAVLRRTESGALLAAAGEVVQSLPRRRAAAPALELTVTGRQGRPLATLALQGARPAQLPQLRAATALIGLALAAEPEPAAAEHQPAPRGPVAVDPADLLADAESERDALADALHDGPVQDLVAARYAADLAARTGDAALVREAVQAALLALRRTMWQLRPRGGEDLPAALEALSGRLVEAGAAPLQLTVAGTELDRVPAAAARAAYRLVQACAVTAVPLDVRVERPVPDGPVTVTVRGAGPLADPARWARTAAAVGGVLDTGPARTALVLPARPPTRDPMPVPMLPALSPTRQTVLPPAKAAP